jgi:hypothetical protein
MPDDGNEHLDADAVEGLLKPQAGLETEVQTAAFDMGEIMNQERERERRQDAERAAERKRQRVESFMQNLQPGSAPDTWNCPCGSVIWDREKHLADHDARNETARKADSADFMNQPIG